MYNNHEKKYPLNQCALYRCRSKKKLARFLNTDLNEVRIIIDTAHYDEFDIPKKDSHELRRISSPNSALKGIQARILQLLRNIERPEWLISGERGKSYVDNARYHQNDDYCLTVDIRKFYDYCQREYAYRFFTDKLLCSSDVAQILSDLCTYNGGIKTGAPTSQIIAYYSYEDMFEEIHSLAVKYDIEFSLYVDDMTFSSTYNFSHKKFIYEIRGILHHYGHDVKLSKIKYFSKHNPKYITGAVIETDHKISVPNALKRKIILTNKRMMVSSDESKIALAKTLLGYITAAHQIEPTLFLSIQKEAKITIKEAAK